MICLRTPIIPLQLHIYGNENYKFKYLAENADGSWNGFKTRPLWSTENERWVLNPKLQRPGRESVVFTPNMGYPDIKKKSPSLITVCKSRIINDMKIIKRVKVGDLLMLSNGQIAQCIHVNNPGGSVMVRPINILTSPNISNLFFEIFWPNINVTLNSAQYSLFGGEYLPRYGSSDTAWKFIIAIVTNNVFFK